jgi:hypothetical protein
MSSTVDNSMDRGEEVDQRVSAGFESLEAEETPPLDKAPSSTKVRVGRGNGMTMRLASMLVLALLGVAAFAGSAVAGDVHGNGNGNGTGSGDGSATSTAVAGDSSPGNSANAPGHEKKEAEPSQSSPPESVSVAADQTAPTVADGVKPTNETDHDTHAAASSDKTKKYGNGKTAGQIAIQNGAAPGAILHGPGNSQPHKVAPCTGGHEVDVHALKGKGHRKACGTPSSPEGPNPGSDTNGGSDPKPGRSDPAGGSGSVTPDPGNSSPTGGVSPSSTEAGSNAVLSAAAVVSQGSLPFTGFPLWGVVLLAGTLIAVGLSLRRRARATI